MAAEYTNHVVECHFGFFLNLREGQMIVVNAHFDNVGGHIVETLGGQIRVGRTQTASEKLQRIARIAVCNDRGGHETLHAVERTSWQTLRVDVVARVECDCLSIETLELSFVQTEAFVTNLIVDTHVETATVGHIQQLLAIRETIEARVVVAGVQHGVHELGVAERGARIRQRVIFEHGAVTVRRLMLAREEAVHYNVGAHADLKI